MMLNFADNPRNSHGSPRMCRNTNLFPSGGVRVQLESKGSIRRERVGMEVREPLGDVGGRDPEPQILDRAAEGGSLLVELLHVLLLIRSEHERN